MKSSRYIALCFALLSFLFLAGPTSADENDPDREVDKVTGPVLEDDC